MPITHEEEARLKGMLTTVEQGGPAPTVEPTPTIQKSKNPRPSLALAGLEPNRRPQARTACENCPNSVWFTSPTQVTCYCRVMYITTWSNKTPQVITNCDGLFLSQADSNL